MSRVFAAGVFDFFHDGHRFFLQSAKNLGDELFVVVARDENVFLKKGFFPHFSEKSRAAKIRRSQIADRVFLGDKKDFFKSVEKIRPDILALGYDQKLPKNFQKKFPHIKIKKIPAKNPEKWKSSIFRKL